MPSLQQTAPRYVRARARLVMPSQPQLLLRVVWVLSQVLRALDTDGLGIIEGVMEDYMVDSIFSVDFKFSVADKSMLTTSQRSLM